MVSSVYRGLRYTAEEAAGTALVNTIGTHSLTYLLTYYLVTFLFFSLRRPSIEYRHYVQLYIHLASQDDNWLGVTENKS